MIEFDNIVVIDTETTGPNPFKHELLSLALVPMDRSLPSLEIHIEIPNDVQWSDFARKNFARFEPAWRQRALDTDAAALAIQEYLAEINKGRLITLAGHNVGFDRAFFQKLAYKSCINEFTGVSHRNLDTHSLILGDVLRGYLPENVTASDNAFNFFQISVADNLRHTALGDATATRDLLFKLIEFRSLS